MATPNELYGWFPTDVPIPGGSQSRWQIPERAPGNLAPVPQGISPNFSPGPFSQLAYDMAGRPSMTPPKGVSMPAANFGGDFADTGGGILGGMLGGLQNNQSGLGNLQKALTPKDSAIQQPSQLNELGSKVGLTSGLSGGWGSGANLNAAVQGQLGSTPALGTGPGGVLTTGAPAAVLATDMGAIGSGAAANAALAEAGFGSGAASTGLGAGSSGGLLASSGLSTAVPIAAIAWMAADALNKSGDIKSGATSAMIEGLAGQFGWDWVPGRVPTWRLPDGRLVRAGDKARTASEAWRKGDQAGFEKAYNDWINDAFTPGGERSFQDWARGH